MDLTEIIDNSRFYRPLLNSVDIICVKTSMNSPCPDGDTDSCAWANKVVYVSGMTTGVVNITPQENDIDMCASAYMMVADIKFDSS